MMTDPTGRSFLSYRRSRLDEARYLIQAQHEMGVPTWQDIRNLQEGVTPARLRQVLADPTIASALLWLTPGVAQSATIRDVEVPAIVGRLAAKDPFFLVPCVAGGLDYMEGAALIADRTGTLDPAAWNLCKVDGNPIDMDEARRIARRVLENRVARLHDVLEPEKPLRLRCMTWHSPSFEPGWGLSLDWSTHFDKRHASPEAWANALLPALDTVRNTIREYSPGRLVEATGNLTLSAAIALGVAFLSVSKLALAWRQTWAENPEGQLWRLDASITDPGLRIDLDEGVPGRKDLAVLISLGEDVVPAFSASRGHLPPFVGTLSIRSPLSAENPFQRRHLRAPEEAVAVAKAIIEAVRDARNMYPGAHLHLFAAIPAGLAVLLGQLFNTLGPVQLYEHFEISSVGEYRPSVVVQAGQ